MIYFFIFAVSFIIVYLITPNIRYAALRFYVIDKKNHRKIHNKVITKLGGLAIYFGFLGGLMIATVFEPGFLKADIFQIIGLIICSTLMLILGVYDDFQSSGAFTKLLIQTIIALLLIKIGFKLERIFIPGLMDINFGILSIPITVLWLLGITNAINLIDGLDGLAAGIVAIISLFFCLYGVFLKENFVIFTSLALMGSSLAFLKYNFHPAKIFMGDTGSLFLGFVIGCLGIYRSKLGNLNNPFFLPAAFTLLLPIMDIVLAVIRRLLRKQHVFSSDFCHIHHLYIKLGFNQIQTVKRFYIMTFCLGIASLSVIYTYLLFFKP